MRTCLPRASSLKAWLICPPSSFDTATGFSPSIKELTVTLWYRALRAEMIDSAIVLIEPSLFVAETFTSTVRSPA